MFYSGKYIDLFENAMQILFVKKGYEAFPHLDAMGKRCFGFYNRNDGKGYYIPLIDTRESIKAIAEYTNLRGKLGIHCPETVEEFMEYVSEGIVYGPLTEEVAVRRIKNLYYHADNRYVYIQKDAKNRYCITDPDGFPVLYYSGEEMRLLFSRERGMVIRLQENDGTYRKTESAQAIWRAGRTFHKMMVESGREMTLCEDAFRSYDGSASSQIALRYGVMNFLGHIEKVWNLVSGLSEGIEERNFRNLQHEMMKMAEEGRADKLPLIETAIWRAFLNEI